jgi:prepilin-type N-terminal cleavage/methylation domain-containing protein
MADPLFWGMRRAFTLPEIMLVLAVTGLLLGIVVPKLSRVNDALAVEAAGNHMVAAHQRARIMAIARGEVMVLSVDADRLTISSRGSRTAPLWSEAGPSATGVTLTGAARQITFSPEGLTLGLSNTTLRLARGSASRSIVISRLGRVRVLR